MAVNRIGLLGIYVTMLLRSSKFENVFDLSCEKIRPNVKCEQVKCSDGMLAENGSLCGVCPICVTYLGENERCGSDPIPPGGVQKTICGPGLECDRGRCRAKNLGCLQDKQHREELVQSKDLFEGTWRPSCSGEEYEAKQCKEHKCYCFGEYGERLFGQASKYLADNMTCACSLALFHKKNRIGTSWMTEPREHCTLDGNYEELQCIGKVCFCADPFTGMHKGQVTHIDYFMLLPCYLPYCMLKGTERMVQTYLKILFHNDANKHGRSYLTECEKIVQRSRQLTHEFYQKGITITGLDEVVCDFDGSFGRTQCLPDSCICTDRNGNKYKSYGIARYHLKDISSMLCNCARDEYDRDNNGAQYPQFQCTSEGNYAFHQTIDREDMCVDEDGEILAYVKDVEDLATVCLNKRNLAAGEGDDSYEYEDYNY